jgi:MarR family transcriptional repressor of emrRAB
MTRICNELADRGLIDRRSSEEDRRGVVISLTDAGRKLVEEVSPGYNAIIKQAYTNINDASMTEYEHVLFRQLENLGG